MLIEAEHEALLRLRKRQYALEALVREIERVTRGETFDIHNDIRWVQMLDYRDKNIIDLASWAKGAYSKGGFLGQLQCHHLRSFGPERAWGNDEDMRGDNYDKTFSEARARLFPGCDGRKLQSTDFEALTTAFKAHSEPLVQDRHQNRAHIYEKNSAGTAKMSD